MPLDPPLYMYYQWRIQHFLWYTITCKVHVNFFRSHAHFLVKPHPFSIKKLLTLPIFFLRISATACHNSSFLSSVAREGGGVPSSLSSVLQPKGGSMHPRNVPPKSTTDHSLITAYSRDIVPSTLVIGSLWSTIQASETMPSTLRLIQTLPSVFGIKL